MITGSWRPPRQDNAEGVWEAILPVFRKNVDDPLKSKQARRLVSNFCPTNYFYSAAAGYPGISAHQASG